MPSGIYERKRRPREERFWEKVDKNGPTQPHMKTPCWVWTAATAGGGYGTFGDYRPRLTQVPAHRIAWEFKHGPVPKGKQVLHRCDHRPCVRHLFLGTPKDNVHDMLKKGRKVNGDHRGVLNGRAKLTEADVRDIRRRGQGRQEVVAREYGVTQVLVSQILRRKVWKHVA
jgi:hypothetical protein